MVESDNNTKRHTVDMDNQHCSCRVWQLIGKPCKHALDCICTNRGKIQDFVHLFYSVKYFRAAYARRIQPMTDRPQWPLIDLGFKVHPSRLRRGASKPRVQRIRGCLKPGRKVKCKRCKQFGHFEKTCKLAKPFNEDDMASQSTPRKSRKPANVDAEVCSSAPNKKKKTPKKKRTPQKRRNLVSCSAPRTRVSRKLSYWISVSRPSHQA